MAEKASRYLRVSEALGHAARLPGAKAEDRQAGAAQWTSPNSQLTDKHRGWRRLQGAAQSPVPRALEQLQQRAQQQQRGEAGNPGQLAWRTFMKAGPPVRAPSSPDAAQSPLPRVWRPGAEDGAAAPRQGREVDQIVEHQGEAPS